MSKRTGPKLILNRKKLKALFPAMMIAPQDKYIAYALGVSKVETIRNWVLNGKVLMAQFDDKLEELDSIFSFEYEAIFEQRKLEFDEKFRMLYDLEPEEKIADRLRLEYNNFMLNEKRKFIEANIFRKENDVLDSITLVEDKDLDEEYKLYINFARIYERAKCVKEIGYLQNIDKHAGTSKNVGLSLKLLEKMNKEDFSDIQTIKHEGNIEVNTKSILSLALNYEKQQREQMLSLDNKKENIIDVVPVNLLEASTKKED